MPNIIEQQDLLKGLPDARLAMLMQNPVGDIPPFLVAAEAQRRQAIRQQFAGAGSNESVVDTLTKQMANVPQNVQAPMQTPPQIPPPMMAPQAGIGAIPQQMAHGGPVRRFQTGSLVTPTFRGRAGAAGYETPSDTWGILGDLYESATSGLGGFTENMRRFGLNPTAEQREQLAAENEVAAAPEYVDPFVAAKRPALRGTKPVIPPDPNAGKDGTSIENKTAAEDSFRKRLEELYRTEEPSNWEEAQKWFAMSQQIMNPDANLMQGLVNAGSVYAQAEAEQASAQRDDQRALQEALLKYDIGKAESEAESVAAGIRAKTDISTGQIEDIRREQYRLYDQIDRIQEGVDKGEIMPEVAAERKAQIQARIDALGVEMTAYKKYIGQQYGFGLFPKVNIATGQIEYPEN